MILQEEKSNFIEKSTTQGNYGKTDYDQEQITPFEDVPLSLNAIPESEIDRAPLLKLEIIEGSSIGAYYHINACGLVGQEGRGRKDGCVLVGSQEYANQIDEPYNDIVIDSDDSSEIGKRHFLIKYNIDTTGYYLRDLGDGNGTFVRLDTPLVLKTGFIISFGDSHMFIQIVEDLNECISKLEIKFLDGPKTDQTYTFMEALGQEDSRVAKTIKIGRMAECDIKFNSKGLSR